MSIGISIGNGSQNHYYLGAADMLPECLGNTVEMSQRCCCYPIVAATTAAAAAERQARLKYVFSRANATISNNAFLLYYPFSTLSDLLSTENHLSMPNKYLARR